MQISNNVASIPALFLQDPLSCRHYTTRYVIRTESGFLAACTGIGGVTDGAKQRAGDRGELLAIRGE